MPRLDPLLRAFLDGARGLNSLTTIPVVVQPSAGVSIAKLRVGLANLVQSAYETKQGTLNATVTAGDLPALCKRSDIESVRMERVHHAM